MKSDIQILKINVFRFYFQIPEIITFLMLLIVFIAAYGVGSQAIINPYRQFNGDWQSVEELIQGIFFLPYWQMYGELNLESVEVRDPDPDGGCLNITTAMTKNVSFIETCSAPDLYDIKESKTVII